MKHASKIGFMLFTVAVATTTTFVGVQALRCAQRRQPRGSVPRRRPERPKYRKRPSTCNWPGRNRKPPRPWPRKGIRNGPRRCCCAPNPTPSWLSCFHTRMPRRPRPLQRWSVYANSVETTNKAVTPKE